MVFVPTNKKYKIMGMFLSFSTKLPYEKLDNKFTMASVLWNNPNRVQEFLTGYSEGKYNSLYITYKNKQEAIVVNDFLDKITNLHTLVFANWGDARCKNFEWILPESILKHKHSMKGFYIQKKYNGIDLNFVNELHRLQGLYFSLSNFNLSTLNIKNLYSLGVSDLDLRNYQFPENSLIQALSLNNYQISADFSLLNLRHLRFLSVGTNGKPIDINFLSELSQIEYLSIGGGGIEEIPDLSNCTNLKLVSISAPTDLTNISGLFKAPNLEVFSISRTILKAEAFLPLLDKPKMKHINIYFASIRDQDKAEEFGIEKMLPESEWDKWQHHVLQEL
jgi:hypothetical protein